MTNMPTDWPIGEYKDVESKNFYADALASGDPDVLEKTMHGLRILARDHARTPFQWDGGAKNAGFSDADETWMRVHDGYREINAKKQTGDSGSVLEFWRTMLKVRKSLADIFVYGAFLSLEADDLDRYIYVKQSAVDIAGRTGAKRKGLVVMNWSRKTLKIDYAHEMLGCADNHVRMLVSTTEGTKTGAAEPRVLQPWEGRIYLNFQA